MWCILTTYKLTKFCFTILLLHHLHHLEHSEALLKHLWVVLFTVHSTYISVTYWKLLKSISSWKLQQSERFVTGLWYRMCTQTSKHWIKCECWPVTVCGVNSIRSTLRMGTTLSLAWKIQRNTYVTVPPRFKGHRCSTSPHMDDYRQSLENATRHWHNFIQLLITKWNFGAEHGNSHLSPIKLRVRAICYAYCKEKN